MDIMEAIVSSQNNHIDPFETNLIYGDLLDIVDDEEKEYVLWMDSFG